MGVKHLLGIEEHDENAVEQPNLRSTTKALHRRPPIQSVALTGLFLIALFYTLYFARVFFIPVTLAIVFNFLLSPFVRALKRAHVPNAAGAGIVMIAGFAFVGLIIYEFSAPVSQWVARTPQIVAKVADELQKFKKPVEKVTQGMSDMAGTSNPAQKPAPVDINTSLAGGLFTRTRDAVYGLVVLVVLLYFLLASGDLFLRKLVHVLPKFEDQKRAVIIMRDIEDHISKYLLTVAMINAGLGAAGGVVFWLLGMPNPALWGALGCALNFIPYIGALTEIGIVGLVAAATFPSLAHALLIPACYLGLAVTEGTVVTPLIMGRRMTLNPVVIFTGVTFWGFLWGFLGIFLAVPMLVMLKIFCDHIEPLAPIGEFLGS